MTNESMSNHSRGATCRRVLCHQDVFTSRTGVCASKWCDQPGAPAACVDADEYMPCAAHLVRRPPYVSDVRGDKVCRRAIKSECVI